MKGCSYANVASPFLNIHVSGRLWLWLPWSKCHRTRACQHLLLFEIFMRTRILNHLSSGRDEQTICPVLCSSHDLIRPWVLMLLRWPGELLIRVEQRAHQPVANSGTLGKIWQDYMSWDNTHDWLPICLMCNDLSCWFGSRAAKPVKRMGKPELIIPGIEASSKKRKLKKNMHQAPQLKDWKTHRREVIGSRKCCLFNYIPNMPKPMRHSVTFVLGAQATSIHGTVETSAEATVCWP